MIRHLTTFSILFICLSVCSDASINYKVSFPNPASHYISMELEVSDISGDSIDLKMPVWIPGSYMVREFAKNVEGFVPENANKQKLPFRKVNKNTWRIYNGGEKSVVVKYDVYAFELSVRTCFVDMSHAYINGTGVFMYAEAFKSAPSTVTFIPHKNWKLISTGIPASESSEWIRTATDYDQLADCPIVIGNQDIISFDYKGIPHHIVMIGNGNYNRDTVRNDFYKIVDVCTQIFGVNPNKDYHFFIHHTNSGGGGLEHMNSSSMITSRNVYANPTAYKGFLSLIAHEYFHLWNVKRIRPLELGPFNYNEEVYTNQLWFFEGFTSFYDDYIVYKSGFYSRKEYLDIVFGNVKTLLNTPGDTIQSLTESSFDAWIKYYRRNENSNNATVSYYTKGGLIAMLLQIDFLAHTNGQKSLDDLMHYLYHEHYQKLNRGLTDEELVAAIETVAGKSYKDFMSQYVTGVQPIPYASFFEKAGILFTEKKPVKRKAGSLSVVFSSGKFAITQVIRGGTAWTYGLSVNDEILAVDGKSGDKLQKAINELKAGELVDIELMRSGEKMIVSVEILPPVTRDFEYTIMEKRSPQQQSVFNKLLPHE
jgi:predicted metalloprotease with PDZ domain